MKVWREGNRIRGEDGTGYGDSVADAEIANFRAFDIARLHALGREVADRAQAVELCDAVLALRAQERAAAPSPVEEAGER